MMGVKDANNMRD